MLCFSQSSFSRYFFTVSLLWILIFLINPGFPEQTIWVELNLSCSFLTEWHSNLLCLATNLFFYFTTWWVFDPLHPNISMHILHTVLYTFPKLLERRICFKTIKSFFGWLLHGWYCREKLHVDTSKRVNCERSKRQL